MNGRFVGEGRGKIFRSLRFDPAFSSKPLTVELKASDVKTRGRIQVWLSAWHKRGGRFKRSSFVKMVTAQASGSRLSDYRFFFEGMISGRKLSRNKSNPGPNFSTVSHLQDLDIVKLDGFGGVDQCLFFNHLEVLNFAGTTHTITQGCITFRGGEARFNIVSRCEGSGSQGCNLRPSGGLLTRGRLNIFSNAIDIPRQGETHRFFDD